MGFEAIWARLAARLREIHLLESTADLCGWDRDVCMPPRGVDQRAAQMELLARLAHERWIDPTLADDLAAARSEVDSTADQDLRNADLVELSRRLDRRRRLPLGLVAECARIETIAQQAWSDARAADRFVDFAPWLERLCALAREKAEALGTPAGGEAWDALGEEYEPGIRAAAVRDLFAELVPVQSALVRRLIDEGRRPTDVARRQPIAEATQESFVREMAVALGFDFSRGRLDRSVHPFTSGTHPDDVRITTRYRADDPFDALYSTIHEVGHGLYDQGLDPRRAGLPTGQPASLGIHESQSRLWENHVGRSTGFWRFAAPRLRAHAGTSPDVHGDEALCAASRIVEPSLIRVDADEATYDLHVAIRHGIEVDLLAGTLAVRDLPARWRRDYRELLGVEVPDDRRGCLQDVHWSAGMFGYFPTYTLGNLAAAQLMAAARAELGDLETCFAAGDFAPLLGWLRDKVHRHGGRFAPGELIRRATGRELGTESFIEHVHSRYLRAYGLA